MTEQKQTTLINSAVIVLGSYHVPASVAAGALCGASLFILSRHSYSNFAKAWLFAVSFFCGIFGGQDATRFLNQIIPDGIKIHANDFTGAAIASVFTILLLQYGIRFLDAKKGAQP